MISVLKIREKGPANGTKLFPPIHQNEPMRLQREHLTDISIKKLTPAAPCVCVRVRVHVADRYTGLPCVSDHPAQREEANPTQRHTHTHSEGIKHLTLAARAVITL